MARRHRGARGRKQHSFSKRVHHYKNQTFWAERGMVHIVDERDGEHEICSLRDFLLRAKALKDEAYRLRDMQKWADERDDLLETVERMIDVAKQAQIQGDPVARPGPAGLRQAQRVAEERLHQLQRSRIIVPGTVSNPTPGKLILPG